MRGWGVRSNGLIYLQHIESYFHLGEIIGSSKNALIALLGGWIYNVPSSVMG